MIRRTARIGMPGTSRWSASRSPLASEDVDTALSRLTSQAHEHQWDLVVGLTELPLRDRDGRYLLIETDAQQRAAVLSLPALGGFRMHARSRLAVRELVNGMADDASEER